MIRRVFAALAAVFTLLGCFGGVAHAQSDSDVVQVCQWSTEGRYLLAEMTSYDLAIAQQSTPSSDLFATSDGTCPSDRLPQDGVIMNSEPMPTADTTDPVSGGPTVPEEDLTPVADDPAPSDQASGPTMGLCALQVEHPMPYDAFPDLPNTADSVNLLSSQGYEWVEAMNGGACPAGVYVLTHNPPTGEADNGLRPALVDTAPISPPTTIPAAAAAPTTPAASMTIAAAPTTASTTASTTKTAVLALPKTGVGPVDPNGVNLGIILSTLASVAGMLAVRRR